MESFFLKPKIYLGKQNLEDILCGAQRVLIVTEKFMVESKKVDYLTEPLKRLGLSYAVFSEVKPDPDVDTVSRGVAFLADFGPDIIIALGGGSSIDCAKGMRFFAKEQGIIKDCPLVAVPTTSGTGSEVTAVTVISDPESSTKYPVFSEGMIPDIALLDANLTMSVPPGVTADTGMDALTHAIEGYVSVDANDFTDACIEKALRLIDENILKVFYNPCDEKSRQHMHNASCLAGMGFANCGLGINHSMAHALGGHFHIPHGRCNAMLLPFVIEYNAGDGKGYAADRYARIARLLERSGRDHFLAVNNLVSRVKSLRDRMGIPKGIAELGIEREQYVKAIPAMAESALKDACTKTNPKKPTPEDLCRLFCRVYDGK